MSKDQGSFIGGFTLGMFAGALGYFLFATEKGKKLKKQIGKEWEVARANLPDRGEGLTNFSSLKELLNHIKERIDESVTETEHKQHSPAKRKVTTKKVTKFKGVKKLEL